MIYFKWMQVLCSLSVTTAAGDSAKGLLFSMVVTVPKPCSSPISLCTNETSLFEHFPFLTTNFHDILSSLTKNSIPLHIARQTVGFKFKLLINDAEVTLLDAISFLHKILCS